MPTLTRSGSLSRAQQLAFQLPDEVRSAEDVRAVVENAVEIATLLEVPLPAVTEIAAADKRFTSARVHVLAKDAIPELTKAANGTIAFGPVVAKTISSLVKSVGYLSSPEYQQTIVESTIQALLNDQRLDQRLKDLAGEGETSRKRQAEDTASSSGARKKPAKRNKHLEVIIHFHYHQLHHKKFESPGYPVLSEKTHWEDPCPGFRRTVTSSDGATQTIRCPDWENEKSADSQGFKAEVVAAAMLEPEWQDESKATAHRLVDTYWKRIVTERKKASDETVRLAAEASAELKAAKGRTTKLVKTMMSSLAKSKIGECFEGRLVKAAMLSGALDPTFWAQDERHPFPKPWKQTIDQSEEGVEPAEGDVIEVDRGYDAWLLFADKKVEGHAGEQPKMWAVDQPQWWSYPIKLGFWYVYEESQPQGSGNFGRTPLFHVPSSLCTQVSPSTLPKILPSSTKELSVLSKPVGDNSRGNKHFEICESMVEGDWANEAIYHDWLESLYHDPPPLSAENNLPSIADWIRDLPDQELRKRVMSHVEPPPEQDPDLLERLWGLRGTDEAAYKAAIRADDLAGHFAVVDMVAHMPAGGI